MLTSSRAPCSPAAINLKIFRRTKLGIQIIFYLLFGNCMISFAFLLSSIFTSTKTAVVVAFLYVFATGLLGELLLRVSCRVIQCNPVLVEGAG